ncbi:MAG: MFS transporter, partial [Acidimicrobiales bacterium]
TLMAAVIGLLVSYRDPTIASGRGKVPAASSPSAAPVGRTPVAELDLRPLVMLAAGMAGAVAASNAMGAFVVPSAADHGVAAGSAGLLSALGSVVGFSTRVGQGWRADIGVHEGVAAAVRHLAAVIAMLSIGILGYAALATGLHVLIVPGVLLAYGAGWGFNGLFNLAVVRAYAHAPARATGVTQVGTYIGGMAGPLAFGLLVAHVSYSAAWSMCAGAAGVGALTLIQGRRMLAKSDASRSLQGSREVGIADVSSPDSW